MNHTLSFFLLSLLLYTIPLFGQYPKEEKIQPYPPPVKSRTLHQRFDCGATGTALWHALHQTQIVPLGEAIQVESSGHDPYVMLPGVKEPLKGTFEFRIRMKNTMKTSAEVFWATEKQPNFNAENALRFNFLPDGEWYTYSIEFTADSPLTQLRFDPGTSAGVAEIDWVELYAVVHDEVPANSTSWLDPDWAKKVEQWHTISSEDVVVKFDVQGTGALICRPDGTPVGEIYPLAYIDTQLPLGGTKNIPFYKEKRSDAVEQRVLTSTMQVSLPPDNTVTFILKELGNNSSRENFLLFHLLDDKLSFTVLTDLKNYDVFGPVFRPYGEMQQAVLCGVEYLEKGEHSSSTADIETKEHLRFAPNPLDVTFPFMGIVTDQVGFGLQWKESDIFKKTLQEEADTSLIDLIIQPIFATPDFLFGDSTKHHLGLYGKVYEGELRMMLPEMFAETRKYNNPVWTDLDILITLAFFDRKKLPDLPKRLRNDEEQQLLNLAAFEKSCIVAPDGQGWRHAALAGAEQQNFGVMFGSDFVTSIWQLTGKLPENRPLAPGGGHLPNPASYFLMGQAETFRVWKENESKKIRSEQRPDGSFAYEGKYRKGHWEDTASGHCGNALYRLLYTYQILGEPEALATALKGLEFANKFTTPRGAQVWELSLHTPDIMASSRMCMANVWAYEATGDKKYLFHAQRWAITGLPFVYLWDKPLAGKNDPVMCYATTPVFGATNWSAPNWIGLPVQWCGLDYAEACFMLAEHDQGFEWKQIAEGILITAERMQYTEGPSIGLLPDSFTLESQTPNPFDINPSVLVQQRRRLQGKVPSLSIAVSADKKYRVVSPYKTTIDGNTAVIEGVAGTSYQIIVNGEDVKTIQSQGIDRIGL